MKKKLPPLSPDACHVYEMLKENGPLTIVKIKELGFTSITPAHLNALKTRGLVSDITIEIEVPTVVRRRAQLYTAIKKI